MINRMTTLEEPPPSYVAPLNPRAMARSEPAEGWGTRIERFLGEHPILALSAGAVAGILIGCLVKRR